MTNNNKTESTAFLLTAQGYDHRITTRLVTDAELKNSEFIRGVRKLGHSLDIQAAKWPAFVSNLYSSYKGTIIDQNGNEVMLDLSCFGVDEETIMHGSDDELMKANRRIYTWFQEFFGLPSYEVKPRVRKEAKERVRIVCTILKTAYAAEFFFIGLQTANDNHPS